MAVTPAAFARGILPNATAAFYTVPANTKAILKRAVFTNYTAAGHTLSVTVTPSGGSAFTLIDAMTIAAHTAYVANELGNMVLNAGDVVAAWADAGTAITGFISGFTA